MKEPPPTATLQAEDPDKVALALAHLLAQGNQVRREEPKKQGEAN